MSEALHEIMAAEESGHAPRNKDLKLAEDTPNNSDLANVHKTHRLRVRDLTKELEDPVRAERLKLQFSNVQLSWYDKAQLELLRSRLAYRTITETVRFLRQNYEAREPILPEASPESVFSDDIPVQVPGRSGSGKTTCVLDLVRSAPGPTLVSDYAGEYLPLKRVTLSDLFALKWSKAGADIKIRFVPSSDPDVAKSEIRTLFALLNRTKVIGHRPGKVTPSGALSRWLFVTEEAHRVHKELVFLSWLAESRKFVRKNIVVASDPSLFASICKVMRPPPVTEARQ